MIESHLNEEYESKIHRSELEISPEGSESWSPYTRESLEGKEFNGWSRHGLPLVGEIAEILVQAA
jgi:hypothetical protein